MLSSGCAFSNVLHFGVTHLWHKFYHGPFFALVSCGDHLLFSVKIYIGVAAILFYSSILEVGIWLWNIRGIDYI